MWLSALLLGSVVDYMAEQFKSQVEDGLNSQPVSQQINYQGESIHFTHRLWRIEPSSVCADKRTDPAALSRCQLAAQALFRQQCEALGQVAPGGDDATLGSQRAMYCAALHDYTPTKQLNAQQQSAASQTTTKGGAVQVPAAGKSANLVQRDSPAAQIDDLLRQCKRLTVLAWISKDASRQAERDKVCSQYEQSKSLTPAGQKQG
ncbi:MAG: hypothetical protein ACRCRW_07225 [Aeromonadaceae bacterium]